MVQYSPSYSMAVYGGALAIAATCTFALVLPTAPPLAVAGAMGINVGVFFFCALIAAFLLPEDSTALKVLPFLGDKNVPPCNFGIYPL